MNAGHQRIRLRTEGAFDSRCEPNRFAGFADIFPFVFDHPQIIPPKEAGRERKALIGSFRLPHPASPWIEWRAWL